jgi:putative membrane protein
MMYHMPGWGWGFGGGIFMILWWVVIIAAIVALVRWLMTSSSRRSDSGALDILSRRYASGEITREEYERMRHDIEHPGPTT